MHTFRVGVTVVLLALWACTTEQVATPASKPVFHDDMLEALRQGVESELEQPVVIDVDELRKNERWAFVTAVSLTADRKPIDYSQTKFAADVADGVFDDWLCALLENEGEGWRLVALEIGATDVPFMDWPERYGVPKAIVLP
ncbi:MAG: hypothetical protein ACR2P1_26435 [Pseudomonadales bacterium]